MASTAIDRKLLKNLDWAMLVVVLSLMGLGILVVSSATQTNQVPGPTYFVEHQILWVALGLGAIFAVLLVDYADFRRFAWILYVLNLFLLIAVLVLGSSRLGAQRWIEIGPFNFQPSEFAKLLLIITLSSHLARRQGELKSWLDLVLPILHVVPPMVLVLLQPDLGTSLVFVAILAGVLFMAGAPVSKLAAVFGSAIAAMVSIIYLHVAFGLPVPLKEYQVKRLIVFINPDMDPLGAGYHIRQSLIAIGSGRLAGKGLFAGAQNQLKFIPEQHTDFVFSVLGEELGFLGALTLLSLYFALIMLAVRAAREAKDDFGALLCAGLISMFLFHILVNVGMTTGIMPVTGIPLPFISYGGSSMLANSLAVGLLLNVRMRRHKILF